MTERKEETPPSHTPHIEIIVNMFKLSLSSNLLLRELVSSLRVLGPDT